MVHAHLGLHTDAEPPTPARPTPANCPKGPARAPRSPSLGRGWTVHLADEAALKLREAAGAWTESYPAMEYRHGPISVTTRTAPRPGCWARQPRASPTRSAPPAPGESPAASTRFAELVRAQRLAVAVAAARGLDPDRPRHLTRLR
ncbi:Phosphosugar isomerase OS=Streptomyces glaucescens OX=1907 GN=SGLAU_03800 PE=4 SV=1 [Streptomyces glaucescens]